MKLIIGSDHGGFELKKSIIEYLDKEGIAANKVHGIRAALCHDMFSAEYCRRHNDANILTMGGRVIGPGLAIEIVRLFLTTGFDGGRHAERLNMVKEMDT